VPESKTSGRPHGRRVVVALCTAAVTALGGVLVVPSSSADPKPSLEEIQAEVDRLHHAAEQAQERYNGATDKLTEAQRRIERANDAVKRQEGRVAEVATSMGAFAAASYQSGGIDPTLQTFLSDNPDTFLAQASVVDSFATQQINKLSEARGIRRELDQARILAGDETRRLEAIEAEMAAEKEKVESNAEKAEAILAELEQEERERLEEIERIREREQEESRGDDDSSDDDSSDDDGGDEEPAPDVPASGKGKIVVDFAMAQLGEPYSYGATGPSSWDCSGLTSAAWREAGVSISRTSSSQIGDGSRVSTSNLQPGDLVFYYSPISHVGIYIGDGKIVHATHPGDVVSVDPLHSMPLVGASRPG
jgi:peptidoglycan DL-endopeptidase CwlO